MESSNKVLLRDGLINVCGLALFGLLYPGPVRATDPFVFAASALLFARLTYLSEHRAFPERLYDLSDYLREHLLVAIGVTALAALALLAPLYFYPDFSLQYFYDGIIGMYVGALGYRVVFGVIRPVPERARAHV